MTRQAAMLATAFIITAPGAAAQDVQTDWDRSINFAQYRTYSWLRDNNLTGNALLDGRIVNAVDTQLVAKGWRRQDHAGDVVLAAHVATRDRAMLKGFYATWAPGMDWSGVGTMGIVSELSQGTLIVDIVDAQTRKLVWRGAATSSISSQPEKSDKKINKALEKMFKNFPVTAPVSQTEESTRYESFFVGTYAGTLPCADCAGIGTELTLYADTRSQGEGMYLLSEHYLRTRDGDRSLDTRGRWIVSRGTPHDPDAVVYQLTADADPSHVRHLVRVGDNAVRQLDRERGEMPSRASFTLTRVTGR